MSRQKQQIYEFDNFRLDAAERQLLRDGEIVPLPSKAFDLLLVLVENNGRLVEKEKLYQRVWADQVVEESNLTVQMSAIRKALGERRDNPRYILTVAGYGYRFIGDVVNLNEDAEVVIETETLSRIVIQREEEKTASPRQICIPLSSGAIQRKRRRASPPLNFHQRRRLHHSAAGASRYWQGCYFCWLE